IVILSKSRLLQCATIILAFASAPLLHSQTSQALLTAAASVEPDSTLPDSPSYSSSQDKAAQTPVTDQTTPPADETPKQRKARERAEADRQVKEEEKQRIGGIMPN